MRIGFIGRFKPLHDGGAVLLRNICRKADHVVIGIGSTNKYNVRNPWTAQESREMIEVFLDNEDIINYEVVMVPDFGGDGQKWKTSVLWKFGKLDYFVSGNDYVRKLLVNKYDIIHPGSLIPVDQQIRLRATEVRVAMAKGGTWMNSVPPEVADYMINANLVNRFREEFGDETIAVNFGKKYWENESTEEQKKNSQEE